MAIQDPITSCLGDARKPPNRQKKNHNVNNKSRPNLWHDQSIAAQYSWHVRPCNAWLPPGRFQHGVELMPGPCASAVCRGRSSAKNSLHNSTSPDSDIGAASMFHIELGSHRQSFFSFASIHHWRLQALVPPSTFPSSVIITLLLHPASPTVSRGCPPPS